MSETRIPRVLILSIYSDSPLYRQMLEQQRKYINRDNENIKYYFIQFRKQMNEVEIDNDFIYVNGVEDRMKITEKTLKSMKYILKDSKNEHYDFIVRTNISTIIHFNNLIDFLGSIPKNNIYCTGCPLNLQWIDTSSGIYNTSLFGTIYASGTSIILSNDVAEFMVDNLSKFRHDIVDDVSIGVFMKKYLPSALESFQTHKASFLVIENVEMTKKSNDYVFIRNRINSNERLRKDDLIHMNNTIQIIYNRWVYEVTFEMNEKNYFHKSNLT